MKYRLLLILAVFFTGTMQASAKPGKSATLPKAGTTANGGKTSRVVPGAPNGRLYRVDTTNVKSKSDSYSVTIYTCHLHKNEEIVLGKASVMKEEDPSSCCMFPREQIKVTFDHCRDGYESTLKETARQHCITKYPKLKIAWGEFPKKK